MKKKFKNQLSEIPGIGPSISQDLKNIGINEISDLIGQEPEKLYELSNEYVGKVQDRCLLYVFRCAVYYANTDEKNRQEEKLKWWNWKD